MFLSVVVRTYQKWKTLSPGIHDDTLTDDSFLNIVADKVYIYMEAVFYIDSGLFQQNNSHGSKMVLEWFKEHSKCCVNLT